MHAFTLTLTLEEGQALLDLMDAAVRSGGLAAASKALPLAHRIQEAGNASKAMTEPAEQDDIPFTGRP